MTACKAITICWGCSGDGSVIIGSILQCVNNEFFFCSQEGLLSDEEAQEVTRLLSPADEKDQEDPEWLTDVLSVTSDSLIQESTLDYRCV